MKTKFSISGNLQNLLDDILAEGYTMADLKYFNIETDWTDCYYESDSPSFAATYRAPVTSKKH